MTPAERAYPIQDCELLAVVQTLEHHEPELLETKFFVVTDHQALLYWSSKRLLSTRQVRWADFLANFEITFQYCRGVENVAADTLSRKTVDTPSYSQGARTRGPHVSVNPTRENRTPGSRSQPSVTSTQRSRSRRSDQARNEKQNLGTQDEKIIVPTTTSDQSIHLLKQNYWWTGLTKDTKQYIRNCRMCGRNKKRNDKTPGLLHPLPIPNHVWEQIVVDGKDMPLDEYGYDYVWAFICKFSRILATLPGKKNDTAEVVAQR